jgi:predicted O-methyltransferase YrrM
VRRIISDMSDPAHLSPETVETWYAGKTFSSDWTSWHFSTWMKILGPLRDEPVRILEIGSWEGRSALFFLNYLPRAQLVCVDTFGGNVEHHRDPWFAALVPEAEQRFDTNTTAFVTRIEKRKGPASDVLPELGIEPRRFDIAYVDGSHLAKDVYSDAVLTWSLMAPEGIVIFDDYEFDQNETELERPKLGIDAFLKAIEGQYRLIHKDYQLVIAKP